MAKRTDSNQAEIVRALRDYGASVYDTHMVGHGFADLVIGFAGKTFLFEVKTKDGRITPDELIFSSNWRGNYYIVRSVDEAIQILQDGVSDD